MHRRATPAYMLFSALAATAWFTCVQPAAAQGVQAAAAAYARGQQAQLSGDNASAAALFELADQAAPSPQALRSAIRNHQEAGQLARAATLSLAALHRYAEEPETTALAHEVLATARETLGRIRVTCEPACSLAIDGRAAHHEPLAVHDGFQEPGERALIATWPDRPSVEQAVTLVVGETAEVTIEGLLPEPVIEEPEPVIEEPVDPVVVVAPTQEPAPAETGGGLHPAIFLSAAGVTVLGAALITWSGVDVLSSRDAYVANPTRQGYDDGVAAELRTNAIVVGTAAVGVTAVLLAIFTDWGADASDDAIDAAVSIGPNGAFALVSGAFDGASR